MSNQGQSVSSQELNAQIQYKLIEELSASEKRYRELVESVREVVFRCESTGEISFLNRAWTEILGYSIDEALGKSLADFIHSDDRKRGAALLTKQLDDDKYYEKTEELRFLHQNGSYKWLLLAVRASDGERKVGSLYDVDNSRRAKEALLEAKDQLEERVQKRTAQLAKSNEKLEKEVEERRRAQEELREAFGKLKQTQENLLKAERLAAVGETSGRVAHEVLNPITSIYSRIEQNIQYWKRIKDNLKTMQDIVHDWKQEYQNQTFMEYLASSTEDGDSYGEEDFRLLHKLTSSSIDFQAQREEDLIFMYKQLQRVIRIINGLRDSARTQRLITVFNLAATINEALEALEDSLAKRNIKTVKSFPGAPYRIKADESEIIQIFTNIFRNAMQSIDEKMQKGGTIEVTAQRADKIINVFIKDTGCGIPEDSQKDVFNFNFSTKSRTEGTGFGLGISRRFVRECGGDLFLVESRPGLSTIFQLQLPAYED